MAKPMAAFLFGLALLASAPGCVPEVPASPTYSKDVRPIFMARCVRCHDETPRMETLPDGGHGLGTPSCRLNRYETTGDCSTAGTMAGLCLLGAGDCGSLVAAYTISINGSVPFMPPAPAPMLDDWQQDVIMGWLKNMVNGKPAP